MSHIVGGVGSAAWSLKDWVYLLGFLVTIGGLFFSGWNALIQSKLKSLSSFWAKWDSFKEKYAEDRLADAKEFATKKEVARAVERLEDKIDGSEQRIENRLKILEGKIDRLLEAA